MNPKQLFLLILLIPTLAIVGCEGEVGPQGPAGADGANGLDGLDGANGSSPAVCMECHTGGPEDLLQIALEYVQSGHKAGEYVGYAGGRESCAKCHSKQGFNQYAVNGAVDGNIADPASIDCSTCHAVHPDAFGLRLSGGVTLISDPTYTLDFFGDSNLCANCHQTRRAEPNVAAPGDSFAITSTHYGPHHGPQGNVLEGVGFAEIAGSVSYPPPSNDNGHLSVGVACIDCHMDTYADGAGGHTWHPTVSTCGGCHAGASDFDINGFQTATHDKLVVLRDRLVELGVVEYVEEDEAYEPVVGTYPMIQAQAFFNWIGLEEDRSLGAHNPGYFDALLDNTIEALAP